MRFIITMILIFIIIYFVNCQKGLLSSQTYKINSKYNNNTENFDMNQLDINKISTNKVIKEYIPFYVIHLLDRIDRIPLMDEQFKLINKHGIYINAVNGNSLHLDNLYSTKILDYPSDNKRPLRRGEIGCFISHYYAWDILSTSKYQHALILEDDIIFADNFNLKFERILEQIKNIEWDVIYLGRSPICERVFGKKCYTGETKTKDLFKPNELGYGMFGYLINKKFAIKLINEMYPSDKLSNYSINEPVDVYFRRLFMEQKMIAYATKNDIVIVRDISDSDTVSIV